MMHVFRNAGYGGPLYIAHVCELEHRGEGGVDKPRNVLQAKVPCTLRRTILKPPPGHWCSGEAEAVVVAFTTPSSDYRVLPD